MPLNERLLIGRKEITTPSSPDSGYAFMYPKNDGFWYTKDNAGTERRLSNGMATDTIWDAAGDVVIGTGADAAARLAIGTAAGKALVADPNATNKASIQFPHGVEEALRGMASTTLATTFDRAIATEVNFAALLTGRITIVRIVLPKGLSISNIAFWSAGTALTVGVNQWFALFNNSLGKLAVTADDTNAARGTFAMKSLSVASGPFVTTYSGLHYLGVMVKATTVPTLTAVGGNTQIIRTGQSSQYVCSSGDTGLTNPASCPSTLGTPNSLNSTVYAEVS